MSNTCEGCVHSRPIVGDEDYISLRCFRYPPQVFVFEGEICQTSPEANERCGEFEMTSTRPDLRNPECVERWSHCQEGGIDSRCCNFPYPCSPGEHDRIIYNACNED